MLGLTVQNRYRPKTEVWYPLAVVPERRGWPVLLIDK